MENQYNKLTDLILEWNEKINLTAIKDREEFYNKNIIDSLAVLNCKQFSNANSIMDMGTGGGFPGLPLAIACPDKQFVLVDSIVKKLKVIDDVCKKMNISNVKTLHSRAEDLPKDFAFDCVVSRAVANMSTLSEYCLPFVKLGGYFIAFKTVDAKAEIDVAKHAIKILGGEIEAIEEDGVMGSGHLFVIIKKIKDTPASYPRKAGEPSKKPL